MGGDIERLMTAARASDAKKYDLAKLHSEMTAVLLAPLLAQKKRELDAAGAGNGEGQLSFGDEVQIASHAASLILHAHGLE